MWCVGTVNSMNNADASPTSSLAGGSRGTMALVRRSLARRRRAERRFRLYGVSAIVVALIFLSLLFASIIGNGYTAFLQTYIKLDVYFDPQIIDPSGEQDLQTLSRANYGALVKQAVSDLFPEVTQRREKRRLYGVVSTGADFTLRRMVLANPSDERQHLPGAPAVPAHSGGKGAPAALPRCGQCIQSLPGSVPSAGSRSGSRDPGFGSY